MYDLITANVFSQSAVNEWVCAYIVMKYHNLVITRDILYHVGVCLPSWFDNLHVCLPTWFGHAGDPSPAPLGDQCELYNTWLIVAVVEVVLGNSFTSGYPLIKGKHAPLPVSLFQVCVYVC